MHALQGCSSFPDPCRIGGSSKGQIYAGQEIMNTATNFLFPLSEQRDPMCPPAARALHSIRDKCSGILAIMPDGFLLLLLPAISKNEITRV